ncbi:alpha/beta hydrolase family protein [Rhodococcus sp. ARC_M13]|uniref:alpha/beta hydrolase n=1 Tax=unclassified Rhodococcus (in: high G+C Gram-positive bacteria) TaxID=192944 RepID=UPI001FB30DAB|nr:MULTISPECIES: alpha/beta hydrolase [unclassified Rhodococcus (in: high G+C Gram-positive bacteria)]MCJ0899176.1 alpha/beta hydrolase family protein [Rhodococcus sp. ARC_M13]MCJ0950557.1 alpha/beta hydrolase family protein [Rhodococcus sp. ARC_M8]
MTTISHARGCLPNSMVDYATSLLASNTTFTDQMHRMDRAVDATMDTWQGEAAAAASARNLSEGLAASNIDTAVIAIAEAHASHGAILDGIRTSLLAIVDLEVPGAGMTVSDDGAVTAPTVPIGGAVVIAALLQSRLDRQADDIEVRIKALLAQFGDGELRAAQAIRAAQQQLDVASNSPQAGAISPVVSDIVSGTTSLPSDPAQLHELWSTLSPADKDALFAHDNYIGNRDGLPVVDRDHYNRIKLDDELARAEACDPTVSNRLADLQAVRDTIEKDPNRMLMLLDTQSGAQTHAAVAVGNPDTADHVSVTTPGLNTTVGGAIGAMTEEGTMMKETTEGLLELVPGRESETVSTIAWIGYDAPQLDKDDYFSEESIAGAIQVAQPWNAQAAAPNLSQFYEGIDASNHDGDPHLTAVGHSYGSFTTGLALQQTPDGIVDDVMVYGSPGLGTGHDLDDTSLDTLNIAPGHAYEMTAHDDPVAHMNRFGWSPGYMSEFTHLDTDATTTADGVTRQGATGHSDYPRLGDNNELRTSGYNTAVVIAGLADVPGLLVTGDSALQTGGIDILDGLMDLTQ